MSIIRSLLPILAVVGLILAPVARPAMAIAADMQAAVAHDQPMDHAVMAMPADMPCCPDKALMPDCAKDCPLMAMCAAQAFYDAPQAAGVVTRLVLASVMVPVSDTDLASLSQRPPPRPPRI